MTSPVPFNRQDLLIVARRFWPHCGLTELALLDLARNLREAGHNVTVATLKYARDWSDFFEIHGIRVVRFARPAAGPWNSFRFSRALAKYFSSRTYDAVIVSGVGAEAAAVTRTVDEFTPVVLHVDEGLEGVSGSFHRKHIEICLSADAVVANNQTVARTLQDFRDMPEVSVIDMAIRQPTRTSVDRQSLRDSLTKTHPVVRVEPKQMLVVTFSRMNHDCGLNQLIRAWPLVLRQHPNAKLWLLGEGKKTGKIWDLILRLDICHSVQLPGFFDDLEDIFLAADLYVHADGPSQPGDGMIRAISCGLPAVGVDHGDHSRFGPAIAAKLCAHTGESDWANTILNVLSDREQHLAAVELAQQKMRKMYSPTNQVDQYVKLIHRLSGRVLESAK